MIPTCCNCGKETTPFKCSQCGKVSYCSKQCQRENWKRHKNVCKQNNKRKRKCFICLEEIQDLPKNLKCQHTYHNECFNSVQELSKIGGCLDCQKDSIPEKELKNIYSVVSSIKSSNLNLSKMSSSLDLIFSMADGLNPYISEEGVLKCQAFLFGLFGSETNEKDRLLVHHYVKNLAEKVGGVEHCYHYALNLYFGIGCPIDCQKCVYWLKRGADLGDEKSMYRLGVIFKSGEPGVPQNHKEAFYYFGLSSKKGNIKARFKVAMYHIQGREIIPNGLQKGITLLEECAHYGHVKAKTTLGVIFKDGMDEVTFNYQKSIRYFISAGEDSYSKLHLGDFYLWGLGVKSNVAISKKLYQQSKDLGHPDISDRIYWIKRLEHDVKLRTELNYRINIVNSSVNHSEKSISNDGHHHRVFWSQGRRLI